MVWSKVSIVLPSVPLDSAQWSPSKHMRPPDMVEGSLAEMWLLPSSQYHSATESLSWKHFQRWACPVAHSYLDHGPSSLKQNLRKYNLEAGAKASRPCPAPPPSSLSRVSEWAPRAQLGNPWSHLPHLCCPGNVSHQDKPCPHWKFICHDTTVQCSGGSAPQNHSGTQDYPIIWLHQFPSIPPAQREWLWRVAQEVYTAPTRIARARDQFHGSTKVHGKLGIVIWVPKKKRKENGAGEHVALSATPSLRTLRSREVRWSSPGRTACQHPGLLTSQSRLIHMVQSTPVEGNTVKQTTKKCKPLQTDKHKFKSRLYNLPAEPSWTNP